MVCVGRKPSFRITQHEDEKRHEQDVARSIEEVLPGRTHRGAGRGASGHRPIKKKQQLTLGRAVRWKTCGAGDRNGMVRKTNGNAVHLREWRLMGRGGRAGPKVAALVKAVGK